MRLALGLSLLWMPVVPPSPEPPDDGDGLALVLATEDGDPLGDEDEQGLVEGLCLAKR